MLVEGSVSWAAGAIYWGVDDLQILNTLQLHILRDIFHMRRRKDETWVTWNQNTMRDLRAWLHQVMRWSTRVRNLQFGLAGHWCRQWEDDGGGVQGSPGLMARFLRWRNLEWWKGQQQLSTQAGGVRHPGKFFPANTERDLAEALGVNWMEVASDRASWENARAQWLRHSDTHWCRHRQLALSS